MKVIDSPESTGIPRRCSRQISTYRRSVEEIGIKVGGSDVRVFAEISARCSLCPETWKWMDGVYILQILQSI